MTAHWTDSQKLRVLMRLPWTIRVENDTDGTFVARVAEMPDAIATGNSERELSKELWEALRASLACRLEFHDDIPAPPNARLPWELGVSPPSGAQSIYVGSHVNQLVISQQGLSAV